MVRQRLRKYEESQEQYRNVYFCIYMYACVCTHISCTRQLAQFIKSLGSVSQSPGFKPDLFPMHVTCRLFQLV
jgi:hypothetical protein